MAVVARGQITIRVATDAYTVYQSIDKAAISCDHTGKVLSTLTINSVLSVRCGETPITNFSIGAISTPVGFYSITVNQSSKTVTYTISGNNTTLADAGTIAIPVIVNGQTLAASFGWFKVKAGTPGTPGADATLLDWVADWNSGKTVIDSQSLITPKIFAGVKNSNGTITGTAIGKFALSTRNASGVISTETVNGIYGFKDGYKTFAIDTTGSAQLGYGNEYIKYNAATGKVEFGSAVALAWVGATYIDANGIFTGTLSANTVNAIRINASQITAGTIHADRIDTASLKAALITAGNIEALTLNVTKGKIGGWSLDADSIFRGTKNNTSGACTAASGSVTIGSNGVRGFKWRLDSTGAGAVAGGNISWDAAGNVTFGPSVVLNWTTPINSITTALGGSSYPKLTQISATGIYTGSITATQITAGTISVDRIAAGSITASKLNAASIKADIINVGYINGLSCTFTKGTIGGWVIAAGSISNSHLVLDNTNKRIVVYGASASSTAGQRVQLYYNSDSDYGLFATDASGNCIASLGSANKIAGWIINSSQIYKNNVYLGADGSIVNGTKWKLNNDGSGQIASGNILWNAAGSVTFSAAVSLNWKNDIEAAKTANYGYSYAKNIVINGESGKYYPVIIKGGDQTVKRDILIRRGFSEQAPSDWNGGSSTHMGGLILLIKTNFGGWGGASYSWDIYELSEAYSRMFAGAEHCGNYCMFAVFLRGGGTTGAIYHLYSDQPLDSVMYSDAPVPQVAPQIAYNSDLIFKSGSTLANASAPRTLTAAVEQEIRRRKFISLAQGSDTTLTEHPLTYIGSTGIYTGTLTAVQVNAVAIHAGSITTGTLSADRIAAGSITSAKLDVASIKANIINTDYINGLSCTFVRGKIGGWSIGANDITSGLVGGGGTMPMQIRSAATGAGYWYSGDYRPFGVSMTWHQSNNAGHFVIGQIASAGNSVKTGFMGIQMMAWDHTEYFCLSANYTRSGSKEIYNRIAGWAFDSANIWKNSVYLGSDGSIYNGAKWRLNNDGSGQVASGNISWNAAGAVTFGASVSLNWTNAANNALNSAKSYADTQAGAAKELAQAMAFGRMIYRDPTFFNGSNGVNVYNNSGNGTVTISRISDGNAPNDSKFILRIQNTGAASPECGGFHFGTGCSYRKVFITRIIAKIPVGRNINFATNSIGAGGCSKWLTPNIGTGDWCEYIYKVVCGTSNFSSTNFYYITGTPGVTWDLAYATVFDTTAVEKYTTTIDANGIYTGSIVASQITAGTIDASRINTESIKAAIITAGNINALTLTIDKGYIGGWSINSYQIAKNGVALSSDGSIVNGTKWKLNNDGSGQLASGNISWDIYGNVSMTGAINANSGTIGGFTIGHGRIGSVASGTGSGGGLAIYDDLFRVGSSSSYVLFGNNTFPASSGAGSATGRITNNVYDSWGNNYGLFIDVRNGAKNYGIWSNAPVVASSVITNKIKNIYFTGSGYTIDFSQSSLFFVYASQNYNITLPSASSVAYMFGYSSLPSDFAYVFTFVYNYNWGSTINLQNIRDMNGNLMTLGMARGDVATLLCANYPSFHYQLISQSR